MADVALKNIRKSFGPLVAVNNVSLEVGHGEFVVLLGPTGAGKTTILRLVAGLEKPDKGEITINNTNVVNLPPAERNVAMVFQQYSLYPHLSVRENLEFPLKSPYVKMPASQRATTVEQVAETLHISHKLDNKATALSGGEMQRVSIGRALVRTPEIYLMDEPLSSLDAKLRAELRGELKRIQTESGATLIYVTHDQVEAMTMATKIGVLEQGRLVQFGSPQEIYENPVSRYVAQRLGSPKINIVPVDLFGHGPKDAAYMGLRSEHLLIGDDADSAPTSRVTSVEHLGDQTRLYLDLNGHELVILVPAFTALRSGDSLPIQPKNPLFFRVDGTRI